MDDATRQMIGACYIAACSAAGIGVLDEANQTLADAIASRSVSDPVAREALRILITACPPDTQTELTDAMANLNESGSALAAAVGDDAIARITGYINRRVARLNASSSIDELEACVDMIETLEAAIGRITLTVDA